MSPDCQWREAQGRSRWLGLWLLPLTVAGRYSPRKLSAPDETLGRGP